MRTLIDYQKDITPGEAKRLGEDILIGVYVPDADLMSREDALELATQRDQNAANILEEGCLEGTSTR